MSPLEKMNIERECARLISRYAYLNDARAFDELASLFSDDGVLYRPASPDKPVSGREAILAAFKTRPVDAMTFHLCTDVMIDVEDDSNAVGRSRVLLLAATRASQAGALPTEVRPPVPGTFTDRFVLTESGWKFSERRGSLWIGL